jgi:hypothetical protein
VKRPGEALDDTEAERVLWDAIRQATTDEGHLLYSSFLAAINERDVVLVWDGQPEPDAPPFIVDVATKAMRAAEAEIVRLRAEVERLTAEVGQHMREIDRLHNDPAAWGVHGRPPVGSDPDDPPILCERVDDTDGRPTWRAMGEDVRTLGDEWERRLLDLRSWYAAKNSRAQAQCVYLVRRTQAPQPRTERVPWQQSIGRILPGGKRIIGADETTVRARIKLGTPLNAAYRFVAADGTVEVLVDGAR